MDGDDPGVPKPTPEGRERWGWMGAMSIVLTVLIAIGALIKAIERGVSDESRALYLVVAVVGFGLASIALRR